MSDAEFLRELAKLWDAINELRVKVEALERREKRLSGGFFDD